MAPAPLEPAAAEPARSEGLTKRFGDVVATDGVGIEGRPGEILGLIGRNRSGKTTLLNQLSGALRPSEGRITKAIATQIAALDLHPDGVMTSAYEPDFPSFIKALRATGVNSQVIGSGRIDSPTTFGLGDVAEGVVLAAAGHATEDSPLATFNAFYEETIGAASETVFNPVGYDLATVSEAAVGVAG